MFLSRLRRPAALEPGGFHCFPIVVSAAVTLSLAVALSGPAAAAGAAQLVKGIQTWNSDAIRTDTQFSLRVSPTLSYFEADDGNSGLELWKTDGTAGGTQLVKDIAPGVLGSDPQGFAAVGTELYFTADDGTKGRELWKSDGTPAGTTRITDLVNGAGGSNPDFLVAGGGKLYFATSKTGDPYRHLYSYDGTLRNLGFVRGQFAFFNGFLYYGGAATGAAIAYTLFRTNGTAVGTEYDPDPTFYEFSTAWAPMAVLGTRLYFPATDTSTGGTYLWQTSGGAGASATALVRDQTSARVLQPFNLTPIGTRLFFDSFDGSRAVPWVTDGTQPGTGLLGPLTSNGFQPYTPTDFTSLGSSVYFHGGDGVRGDGLWKTNGNVGDVQKVKFPGSSNQSIIWNLVAAKGRLYFSVDENNPEKHAFWISDGTTAGTKVLKDLGESGYAALTWVRSTSGAKPSLLLFGRDPAHGMELWTGDGTSAGTKLLRDINTHKLSADPANLTPYKGALYFSAERAGKAALLWKSNGTAAGTTLVKELAPGKDGPRSFTVVGPTLYFVAHNGKGWNLWKSDGTTSGTALVKDLQPSNASGFEPRGLAGLNGKVYFIASDGIRGTELWVSDGTSAGTKRVKDIRPGAAGAFDSGGTIVVAGTTLYFAADDGTHGVELWKSDGTAANTSRVSEVAPGNAGSFPYELTADGSTLYFVATPGNGYGVYKTSGSGVATVKPPASNAFPSDLTVVGNTLYFLGFEPATGEEIWTSVSGNPATRFTMQTNPTFGPRSFTALGGDLYFVADDGTNGTELWKTDGVNGTPAHTAMVQDINPTGPSNAQGLTAVNGVLYFGADDGSHGLEPWRTTASGAELVADINPNDRSLDDGRPQFVRVGTDLFFPAARWQSAFELWKVPGV